MSSAQERANAPALLRATGVIVTDAHVELWDDKQLADALVWCDARQDGIPFPRPAFLGDDAVKELSVEFAIIGRRVERIEADNEEATLWFDRGGLSIRLEGD